MVWNESTLAEHTGSSVDKAKEDNVHHISKHMVTELVIRMH